MSISIVDSIPEEKSHDLTVAHRLLSLGPSQHPAAFEGDHEFHDYSWLDAQISSSFEESKGYRYVGNWDALIGYGRWLGYESDDHFLDALSDAMDAHEATFDAEEAAELANEGITLKGSTPDIYVPDATENNQTVLINTEGY